jgi:hypothetical protein
LTISFFVTGFCRQNPQARLSAAQQGDLCAALGSLTGLTRCELGVPAEVQTYHGDAPVPALTLRLDFATLPALERQLSEDGGVCALAVSPLWRSLPLDDVSQQAMLRRCFLDPFAPGGVETGCDYLVHYPGPAEDFNLWLRHYLGHHVPIMTTFPKVRGVDVYTRVDWCDALPWRREAHMQRNRVAFGSVQDLLAALDSPVRELMRQDHGRFPPYREGSRHYPMRVTRLRGASSPTGSAGLLV